MAKDKNKEYALTLRDLYNSLLDRGFTEEQAFYILATLAKKIYDKS